MNANKRLTRLESQLAPNEGNVSTTILVGFCSTEDRDDPLTHIWSNEGVDDCYKLAGEAEVEFQDRAITYIRENTVLGVNNVLVLFGDKGKDPSASVVAL